MKMKSEIIIRVGAKATKEEVCNALKAVGVYMVNEGLLSDQADASINRMYEVVLGQDNIDEQTLVSMWGDVFQTIQTGLDRTGMYRGFNKEFSAIGLFPIPKYRVGKRSVMITLPDRIKVNASLRGKELKIEALASTLSNTAEDDRFDKEVGKALENPPAQQEREGVAFVGKTLLVLYTNPEGLDHWSLIPMSIHSGGRATLRAANFVEMLTAIGTIPLPANETSALEYHPFDRRVAKAREIWMVTNGLMKQKNGPAMREEEPRGTQPKPNIGL